MNAILRTLTLTTAATLVAAWGDSKPNGVEAGVTALKKREPARVLVEPVVVREMVRRLETTTRVESEHQVDLFTRASGIVTDLYVEEGDYVKAGQVLAYFRVGLSETKP